jgi:hypothetical protein
MNLEPFRASTNDDKPPRELSTSLEAIWYQGKGDWEEAHCLASLRIIQVLVGSMHICIEWRETSEIQFTVIV